MIKKEFKYILLILFVFSMAVIFINPRGNFPLNDDWGFAHSVNKLLFDGRLDFFSWFGPIQILQTFYGFLITKITGFSFTVLRLSTLCLSLASILLFYFFIIKDNKCKALTLLTVATLMFNPIFLNLSFTFMTDIPFLFFYLLGLFFLIKGIEKEKNTFLIIGLISAIGSFFIRQIGILLLGSLLVLYLINLKSNNNSEITNKKFNTSFLLFSALAIVICLVGYLIFQKYVSVNNSLYLNFINGSLWLHALRWLFYSIQYLGIFSLPITILLLFDKNTYKKNNFVLFLFFLILLIAITFIFHLFFPYNQNIINDYGLGPNIDVLQGTPTIIFSFNLKIIISLLACWGGALLILALKINYQNNKDNLAKRLISINFIFQLAIVLFLTVFDRYFLLPLPLILLLIIPEIKTNKIGLCVAIFLFLLPLIFFSLTLNRNYMDWNRARSFFYKNLSQHKFYQQIEGGYELNGWYTYESMKNFPDVIDLSKPWYLRRLFTKNTNKYIISFSVLSNYKIVSRVEYFNYFLFKPFKMYVIKK